MPRLSLQVDCPVRDSFRVRQVAGLFDVPPSARSVERFDVEAPDLDGDWRLGLIVGPSGSGKTTVARALFGERLATRPAWPADGAVIDGFGDLPIKQIVGLLTAVGFSSPPAWVKPYRVLSGGEQFRCDLARALAGALVGVTAVPSVAAAVSAARHPAVTGQASEPGANAPTAHAQSTCIADLPLIACDEFTSVVDRRVARAIAAAVAKAVRSGQAPCRFVAVTCHYDVIDWLAPDWVLDMATGKCQRRELRRPSIELAIHRCGREAWAGFARHHYLTTALGRGARCFLAVWEDAAVAFCATLPVIGRRGHWRITRLVTLPDYQGLGIGLRFAEAVADLHRGAGLRVNITASHPAVIAHCRRSPLWRVVGLRKHGSPRARDLRGNYRGSRGRAVASFEFLGGQAKREAPP